MARGLRVREVSGRWVTMLVYMQDHVMMSESLNTNEMNFRFSLVLFCFALFQSLSELGRHNSTEILMCYLFKKY